MFDKLIEGFVALHLKPFFWLMSDFSISSLVVGLLMGILAPLLLIRTLWSKLNFPLLLALKQSYEESWSGFDRQRELWEYEEEYRKALLDPRQNPKRLHCNLLHQCKCAIHGSVSKDEWLRILSLTEEEVKREYDDWIKTVFMHGKIDRLLGALKELNKASRAKSVDYT